MKNHIQHLFFAPDYEEAPENRPSLPVIRFKGIRPLIYPDCRLAFPPYSQVVKILAEFAPDTVHIVTEQGVGYAGLRAARTLGIPVVMSYHTNFDQYLDFYHLTYLNQAVWAYMKWFHSFALLNLCPSRDTMENLRERGFENLDIWTRGIDPARFSPSKRTQSMRRQLGGADKTIFLYVGRIAAEKGLDTLVQSMRMINRTHLNEVRFVFTGDGPYLEQMLAHDIPNAVFTGAKYGEELAQVYAAADAFVFPSGTETFGNVLLEAMASGLPVICTDSGGVRDFTVNGQNALVYPFGDAAALARSMERMLDPVLRAGISAKALKTAESRNWDTIFDGLMRHYRLVAQRSMLASQKL